MSLGFYVLISSKFHLLFSLLAFFMVPTGIYHYLEICTSEIIASNFLLPYHSLHPAHSLSYSDFQTLLAFCLHTIRVHATPPLPPLTALSVWLRLHAPALPSPSSQYWQLHWPTDPPQKVTGTHLHGLAPPSVQGL